MSMGIISHYSSQAISTRKLGGLSCMGAHTIAGILPYLFQILVSGNDTSPLQRVMIEGLYDSPTTSSNPARERDTANATFYYCFREKWNRTTTNTTGAS